MLELKVSEDKIEFGNLVVDSFLHLNNNVAKNRCVLSQIIGDTQYHIPNLKVFYKDFTNKAGITPSKALGLLRAVIWKKYCTYLPNKVLWATCGEGTYKRELNYDAVTKLYQARALVQIALNDNQANLIPILYRLNITPKELKDNVGKACWKRLCNNSITRNKLIGMQLNQYHVEDVSLFDTIKKISYLSSSTLKNFLDLNKLELIVATDKLLKENKLLSARTRRRSVEHMITDTVNMKKELAQSVNYNWSLNRWKEEHEKARDEINSKNYSKEPFSNSTLEDFPRTLVLDAFTGYTATLLNSPWEVYKEGLEMHHCVGSYANSCKNGKYRVYSITDSKGDRSTLGVSITMGGAVRQQHYGYFNSHVDDVTSEFGKEVVREVNKVTPKLVEFGYEVKLDE